MSQVFVFVYECLLMFVSVCECLLMVKLDVRRLIAETVTILPPWGSLALFEEKAKLDKN